MPLFTFYIYIGITICIFLSLLFKIYLRVVELTEIKKAEKELLSALSQIVEIGGSPETCLKQLALRLKEVQRDYFLATSRADGSGTAYYVRHTNSQVTFNYHLGLYNNTAKALFLAGYKFVNDDWRNWKQFVESDES